MVLFCCKENWHYLLAQTYYLVRQFCPVMEYFGLLLCILITVHFQIHRSRLTEKDDDLMELESAMERLLSESDRLKYKPARTFSTETNALINQWRTIEETLQKRTSVINTKVSTI